MANSKEMPRRLKDLIDDYLQGLLDETGTAELETALTSDEAARAYFVRYARLHTDLHLELRALNAGQRALGKIEAYARQGQRPARTEMLARSLKIRRYAVAAVLAASLVLALAAAWWRLESNRGAGNLAAETEPAVAWLVNAQNCQWAGAIDPAENLSAGKALELERGLVEIRMRAGARVLLEGPARLDLLSANSARLVHGKLTARVPDAAKGFEIYSPQGKVIDLGTEFGVAVSDQGATDVHVFEGRVEAYSREQETVGPGGLSLGQNQSARIADGVVRPVDAEAEHFVRAIVPPPVIVPRTLKLRFDQVAQEGVRDARGSYTGLTHRLPGTGSDLPGNDPNLFLDIEKKQLELTTTNSDLNTQYKLPQGEYLGVRLLDLGFTGEEDFTVTATIPNIPTLEVVGQFGLYVGSQSDTSIRGGVLSRREPGQYTQFLVNNQNGVDDDTSKIGLVTTRTDLRLTLSRTSGKYALTVENLTTGSSSTLRIRHPDFLDDEADLYVGLFGANTQSEVRKTLVIKEFAVTVKTVDQASVTSRSQIPRVAP
jgi:ferric-dicitrate binding protein FerR (iron transport regulator)